MKGKSVEIDTLGEGLVAVLSTSRRHVFPRVDPRPVVAGLAPGAGVGASPLFRSCIRRKFWVPSGLPMAWAILYIRVASL